METTGLPDQPHIHVFNSRRNSSFFGQKRKPSERKSSAYAILINEDDEDVDEEATDAMKVLSGEIKDEDLQEPWASLLKDDEKAQKLNEIDPLQNNQVRIETNIIAKINNNCRIILHTKQPEGAHARFQDI